MSDPTSSAPPVEVSVVIPTRNRPDDIEPAVRSVLASDHRAFELVVVDQSDDDATRHHLELIAAGDSRLRYVKMEGVGLSRSRNEGMRRTKGPIVAFLDDDCTVEPSWLPSVVAAFAARSDVGLLYGQVHGSRDLTPALTWDELEEMRRPGHFKVWGMGANHAVRREAFERVLGFDEILGAGAPLKAAEDFDFEYRMYRSGSTILLHPGVEVLHHGRRELEEWPSLTLGYGAGDAACYMKHVRCWDGRVFMLMARRLTRVSGRWLVKSLLRRDTGGDLDYLRGFARGVRNSFKYPIDKATRLYRVP
jgi:glycosyltransferase involved in cell wall biosynthesis